MESKTKKSKTIADKSTIASADKKSPHSCIPFTLTISNNTDEKLYNVPILDFSKDRTDKIRRECLSNVTYEEFLHQFNIKSIEVDAIYVQASGDYHKFVSKQLSQTVWYKMSSADGRVVQTPMLLIYDPYQMQSGVILHKQRFTLGRDSDKGNLHNLILNHLMPEVSTTFKFYYD